MTSSTTLSPRSPPAAVSGSAMTYPPIALIASLIDQAERWLPQLVHDARANGHGWTEIARALGTNPAEARLRFDPESPIADGRWPYDQ